MLRALVVLSLAVMGCGGGGSNGVDSGVDRGVDSTTPPDLAAPDEAVQPDQAPVVGEPQVCGNLVDQAGEAVHEVNVIVCDDVVCAGASSDLSGAFCVSVPEPGEFRFHSYRRVSGGKDYGEVMVPVTITQNDYDTGAKIELGKVVVPLLGQSVKLDAQSGGVLSLGAATLSVPAGATILPPLLTDVDVAFAQVQPAEVHPDLLASYAGSGTLVAAFLFSPMEVTFSAPVDYVLPAGGLPQGTQLELHTPNAKIGKLEKRTAATVGAAETLAPTGGGGLDALGWLLFYKD